MTTPNNANPTKWLIEGMRSPRPDMKMFQIKQLKVGIDQQRAQERPRGLQQLGNFYTADPQRTACGASRAEDGPAHRATVSQSGGRDGLREVYPCPGSKFRGA